MKLFSCQVVTGEKTVFKSEVTSLVAPVYEGYMGVMANHCSLITLLSKGKLTIKDYSKPNAFKVNTFNLKKGVMEIHNNVVTLLVDLDF